jgi:hypothetical protein
VLTAEQVGPLLADVRHDPHVAQAVSVSTPSPQHTG